METTEQSLSQSAGRQRPQAAGALVRELFAEHGRMVLGLCRLLLRDQHDAEDAAQQVFLSAHQAVLRGTVPRDRAAWIAAIARNECRARVRARMREPLALPELPSDLPDPLVAAIHAADLDAVWAALGALPRRQRNALVLREVGGLSYHELGRALGVSHSAVESLLFRARQQLRRVLASAHVAAPVALRDQLAQLIPGFDPSSAGAVARVAALPVALKLAGAAVGVGVVATGAGGVHRTQSATAPHRSHSVVPVEVHPVVRRNVRVVRPRAVVRRRETEVEARHDERRGGRHSADSEGKGPGPGPAPAPVATTTQEQTVLESHEGPGNGGTETHLDGHIEDHSGSGDSGSDGGSGGHSGPG